MTLEEATKVYETLRAEKRQATGPDGAVYTVSVDTYDREYEVWGKAPGAPYGMRKKLRECTEEVKAAVAPLLGGAWAEFKAFQEYKSAVLMSCAEAAERDGTPFYG